MVNRPPDWVAGAACATSGVEPPAWYAKKNTPAREAAVMVCLSCPVRYECLEDALDRQERWGIWGGFDETERRNLLGFRSWPRRFRPAEHGTAARYRAELRAGVTPCEPCATAHRVYHRESKRRRRRAMAAA